ncbi:unnamed protein product [Durusdinium trenchii]|uniref:Serine aminopeptidase S33 domain-containing protein n=1 Tax=Durusdinium trenchii TaxID=1381693 RepID=A0ABP0MKX4_9DINO
MAALARHATLARPLIHSWRTAKAVAVPRVAQAPRNFWGWAGALTVCLALAAKPERRTHCQVAQAAQNSSSCVRLISREAGQEQGKPAKQVKQVVVLIHGLDSWSGTWESLMEDLAKRGLHTLAVDLRGHGESPLGKADDFSPEQLAADVRSTLQAAGLLDVSGCVALVGHSMGGRIAMQYAADYPQDLSLLVIEDMDCVPRSYPSLEGQKLQNCKNFSREFKSWEQARETLISFGYDPERVDGWYASSPPRVYKKNGAVWSCINPFAQYLAKQTVLNSSQGQRSLQQIAALKVSGIADYPVHVCVAGPEGTVCSWDAPGGLRDMESVLPSLRVHEFSGGHSIHNTELQRFANFLEALLLECRN